MKRILCLDGGGAKGIIPATVLAAIEAKLGKKICETFDMIVGSSVGCIIGGILAIDAMTAEKLQKETIAALPQIFKKRFRIPLLQPKYSREVFDDLLQKYIGFGTSMSYCENMFMCTSVNMVDGKTHFFKSWEEKDGKLPLAIAITRSYAAPLFFGGLVDKEEQSVWLDGGTGADNCPLGKVDIEIIRQGWQNEDIHILSIGCGWSTWGVPFKKAKRSKNGRQVLFYSNPAEGGLAREQVTQEKVFHAYEESLVHGNRSFQRLDVRMPKKENGMDKVKYLSQYELYGQEMAENVDYGPLK